MIKDFDYNNNNKKLIILALVLLILISLLTKFYGIGDNSDYTDTAKFFTEKLSSKIRSSHSYLSGYLHSPFVNITNTFFIFKITSLIALFLIIYSVYILSKKNKKTLWLILLSPVVWYVAPSVYPLQWAGLFLLWAYYFINKYNKTDKLKYLFYSGIFIGLGFAIWDTILYFGFLLTFIYMINKKLSHSIYLLFFILIGLMPRLILDTILFNFPFYTILKIAPSGFINLLSKTQGLSSGHTPKTFVTIISVLLATPLYFWIFYKKDFIKNNLKIMIFLTLSFLLILSNPQIRYLIAIVPIIILILGKEISNQQFRKQIIFSLIVILLFIFPYIIQINYSMTPELVGVDFTVLLRENFNLKLEKEFPKDAIRNDLERLTLDYPNKVFVVGNAPDDFQALASLYWGEKVNEFVSIQDYNLYLKNTSVLFEKRFMPIPNINSRRQIWLAGGMNKNENDPTNYEDIKLGIGLREPINIENFVVVEKYGNLYLSKSE